jgi:hypothetical protein
MASEERIEALRKRVSHMQPGKPKVQASHDRSRHTLYLDKTLVKLIDQAFKDTAHEIYPQEIDKADYLEACLKFALANQDKVKTYLLSAIQDT